ncbi:MAG: radical SAM protein, partial [Candidatus Hadarchaeales archaeon]
MELYFDRVFRGYAEEEVASFFGRKIREVVHPPLLGTVGTTLGLKFAPVGVLFTTRGCPMGCKFCQTPSFCPRPSIIPLRNIERVLRFYKRLGLGYVIILDENFGLFRKHAEEVAELLGRYGFMWAPMIRADLLAEKLEEWRRLGMRGALFGIESFDQQVLDDLEKKERAEAVKEVIRRIRLSWRSPGRGIGGIGYYMIGHEEETRESIRAALKELKGLNPGFVQLCILTPLPSTPLWEHLDREYGIFEKDWHRFDCKHLVWNHPHLTRWEMEGLLTWGMREINSPHLLRYLLYRLPEYLRNTSFYVRDLYLAHAIDQRTPFYFPVD